MKLQANKEQVLFDSNKSSSDLFDWIAFEKDPQGFLEKLSSSSRPAFIVAAGFHYRGNSSDISKKLEELLGSVKQ